MLLSWRNILTRGERWNQLLRDYQAPPLDVAKDEELQAYLAKRKAEIPDAWY